MADEQIDIDIEDPQDPFAKYGGKQIEDPFKKYGGAAIEPPKKKVTFDTNPHSYLNLFGKKSEQPSGISSPTQSQLPYEGTTETNNYPSTSTLGFTATDARVGGEAINAEKIASAKSLGKALVTGAGMGVSGTLKWIGKTAKDIDLFNEYNGKKAEELATYRAGKWVDEQVKDLVGELTPEEQSNYSVRLMTNMGQMGTLMLGGVGSRALGMSEGLTAGFMGAAQQGSAEYENAVNMGATPDQASKAFWINTAIGSAQAIPVVGAFRKLDKYTGGLATGTLAKQLASTAEGRITSDIMEGAIVNAAQNAGATILTNVAAMNTYDATRKVFDDMGESLATGGIIGATLHGMTSAIREKRMAGNLTPEENIELGKAEKFAEEKIKEVETKERQAKSIINHAEKVKENLTDKLPEEHHDAYIEQSVIEKVATEKAEKLTDPTLIKEQKGIAKDAAERKEQLLQGKKPEEIVTEKEQKEIEEKEKNQINLQRLHEDNKLDIEKLDAEKESISAQRKGLDGRKPEDRDAIAKLEIKSKEHEVKRKRINEDYQKAVEKLTPKEEVVEAKETVVSKEEPYVGKFLRLQNRNSGTNEKRQNFIKNRKNMSDEEAKKLSDEIDSEHEDYISGMNELSSRKKETDPIKQASEAAWVDIQDPNIAKLFAENPEQGLKEAAQQLNASKGEAETARKVYGDTISDIALKLYPKEKVEAPSPKQTPTVSEPLKENIVYRGSDFKDTDSKENYTPSGYYKGTYFHVGEDAKERSSKFGKELFQADIKDAKLYEINSDKDSDKLKKEASDAGFDVFPASGHNESKYLKSIGYDGIKRGNEVVLFDRQKFEITPSKEQQGVENKKLDEWHDELKKDKNVFWHGSPSGDMRGGEYGLHIGTHEAAKQALEARIGVKADGTDWNGTEEYGKTKLAGQNTLNKIEKEQGKFVKTGYNSDKDVPKEDYYPTERQTRAKYGDGSEIPFNAKPNIQPVRIKGEMSNAPNTPHEDFKANGLMKGQIKKGTAKRGYYYKNIGEDEGSVSAVLPNSKHIEIVEKPQSSNPPSKTVSEVGDGKPKEKTKQENVNDLVDRVNTFNKKPKNAAGRNQEINEIRVAADALGLKFDDRAGKLVNEKGKKVQKRNTDAPSKEATNFDINNYSDETKSHFEAVSKNENSLMGLPIKGRDGRQLTQKQLKDAIKSVKDGKPNIAAQAIFDFLEHSVSEGGIEVTDPSTGRSAIIPMDEYMAAFKEPVKPLTDEEIHQLNYELTEDSFNFETDEHGQEILHKETEQPSTKGTTTSKNEVSGGKETTGTSTKETPKEKLETEVGKPPTEGEPPKPPVEEVPVGEGDGKKKGITHEATQETTRKAGLPDYEGQPVETHAERIAKAKEDIAANPNLANETMEKAEKNAGSITPQDNAVLAVYKGALDKELEANPSKELFDRISRLAKVLNPEGSYAGKLLESRKLIDFNEDNLANFLLEKEAAQGTALTDTQIKNESAKYEELKKAKEKLEEQLQKEREQHAKDIAELGLNKARAKAKKAAKKSHEEYAAERKASVDAAKEALKKIRQDQSLKATVPGFAELKAIAPHIKDVFQSLANEGIDKLDVMVTQLHAEFKDVLDGLTKNNVLDIIGGQYDEKQQTRNQKANTARLLKREAQLLKELADARLGEQKAQTQEKKNTFNRRIDELKKKIEEVRSLNKERMLEDEGVQEKSEYANKQENRPDEKEVEKKSEEQKRIDRLEKELEDLEQGKVKQKGETFEDTEAIKDLKEKIFEAKKNLGLIKSRRVETDTTLGLSETPESKNIRRLEKELDDLRAGILKDKNDKRKPSAIEKDLQDQIFEEKKKLGLFKSKETKSAPHDLKITETEKRIERLEKQKAELEKGIVKQKDVSKEKPSPAQQEKIDKLNDEIFDLKKNLGLLKSKEIKVKEQISEDEKMQKKLADKAKKLEEDIRTKKYLEVKEPPKPFKRSRETQVAQDRVIDLENKIRHERSKDEYEKRSKARKVFDKVMEVLGVRRLVQSAVDISVPFRQGATMISPRQIDVWAKGFKANLQSIFSPKRFERIMYEIRHDKDYHDAVKDGVVYNDLGSADPNLHNEDFRKSFIYNIPIISEPLKASNRSADAFLNVTRYELYKKLRDRLERQGLTRESDPKAFKFIGNWVMSMTGRGHVLNALENPKAQFILGNTFYGARLMASRFNLLNPYTYLDPRVPRQAKYEAMKDMAAFTVTTMAAGLALAAAGGKISLDPDDSDFLQVRFGDKVYDISGGLANYVRTFLRITKAIKTKAEGTKYEGRQAIEKGGQSTVNFFRNKLSPNTSYAADAIFGGRYGQEFDPSDIVRIYPMYTDDVVKSLKEEGISSLATVLLPNLVGIGYGSYASKGQIDKKLEDLKKRNMRSDEMNNEKIYNYNDGGRQITDKEFDDFADKRDAEIEKQVEKLYKEGALVINEKNEVVQKPYKELTPEQLVKETNSIKAAATSKVKKEMFGTEVKSDEKLEAEKELEAIKKEKKAEENDQ